jgi:hypothetical protein
MSYTVDRNDPRVSSAQRAEADSVLKKGIAVAFVCTGRKIELFLEDVGKVWERYLEGKEWNFYLPEDRK